MEEKEKQIAPGEPGIEATWTSSAKSGIGKSITTLSQVSFTIGQGILNEVFFPREDVACIRDMECIVTNGKDFFSEEKKDTKHHIEWMEEGVPAFKLINTCKKNKYCIEKEIFADPIRNTLLQQIKLITPDSTPASSLKLFLLLNPHIRNKGMGNKAWKGEYKGVPMLFAERESTTIAMACSVPVVKRSVGYVGKSDGYTDMKQHYKMEWEYDEAPDGNVALTAEVDPESTGKFVVAIGFGRSEAEAGNNAWSSILDGFDLAKEKYIFEWQRWQRRLKNIKSDNNTLGRDFRKSAAVLRIHESRTFPGAIIASLSKPWGESKGDDGDSTGYHMVWPRDLALSSGGFLELGAKDDVLRILNYLFSVQEPDGRWPQNLWLAGLQHWNGVQMDQIAFPIIMAGTAYQKQHLDEARCYRYWPLIAKSLEYLVCHGPYTQQDRWEEESGYTPFSLSTQISALLSGAMLARVMGMKKLSAFLEEIANSWNANIEKWTYVTGTKTAEEAGVEGYYLRINPYNLPANEVKDRTMDLKNHTGDDGKISIGELISVDALALVRFGLRSPRDPKIKNTIKAIDYKLKVDTPTGPCWHRYNLDGYGEDKYGNSFPNGKGIGRAWPLLTGERAHYEIAAGNMKTAKSLLETMESFANNSLLPEQIWDTDDIPEKGLYLGKASGSAMPLTWAHAEYLKLCSSIRNKRIVDCPSVTLKRYGRKKQSSPFDIWTEENKLTHLDAGKYLRIIVENEATIRWSQDQWKSLQNTETYSPLQGVHCADIVPDGSAKEIVFTVHWEKDNRWEGKNYTVKIN